jgi:hypothetical protein
MEMISAEQIILRGSFSYINDDTSFFIMDDQTQGRITRVDTDIARLYFMTLAADGSYVPGPVPANMRLHNMVTHLDVPVHNNELLITWFGNYELRRGNDTILSLDVQRQQAIRTRLDGGVLEPI